MQKDAGSFVFKPVTPIEIEAEILSIPLNKVYGLYSCPTRILKCASKIISSPSCKLINNSIETGAYPSKLKHAKVVQVYKGEDKLPPGSQNIVKYVSLMRCKWQIENSTRQIVQKLLYSPNRTNRSNRTSVFSDRI